MKKIITYTFLLFLLTNSINLSFSQEIIVDNPPYNAVGDGITDDKDAIQSAIYDLRTNGGTLKFTSGKTYIISEGLNFYTFPDDKNYLVTTTDIGKATIKVQDGAELSWPHWGIRLSESQNVTIQNLIIDGNRETRNPVQEYSGVDVIFIDGASNGTRLENLDLINSPADNIYIVVHDGESPMTDFEMHNCKLENAYRNNMSVISGSNFKIIACEFINANGTPPEAGIDFEPNASSFPYNNILVEGCLFKDNQNYGLMLTHIIDGTGSSTLKNNLFDNNGLLIGSKNNLIHHNIFVNQDHQHSHGSTTRDGIIYFHTDLTPTENEVYKNYFYDNNMPDGSHLINFMYNSGGNNYVHDNFAHGNNVEGFVLNNTNPNTDEQIIINNVFLTRKEMAYWNMDETEITGSSINDLSDFSNDGTIVNASSISGVENEALNFSDNSYIEVPVNDNLNIEMNFTVLAWIKWAGTNIETEQTIVGRNNDWKFGVSNNGELGFFSPAPYTSGLIQSPVNSIPENQWKFVCVTYNGRDVKLYIDGNLSVSQQANGALGTAFSNLYIGSSETINNSFNGLIDDVRIFNYSLNQVQIQSFFDDVTLQVNKYSSANNTIIYPNPVNDKLYISSDFNYKNIEIYDISGKLILKSDEKKSVNVRNLINGIYYMKLINDNYCVLQKFIKN